MNGKGFVSVIFCVGMLTAISFGMAFDLVWFIGVGIDSFLPAGLLLTIMLNAGFILSVVYKSLRRNKFTFSFWNRKTAFYLMIFLVLLGSTLMSMNQAQARDLNEVYHIRHNNSETKYIMNGSNGWVLQVGGVWNATSDQHVTVDCWVDLPYFTNASYVGFGYFNGTSRVEGENRTTSEGAPNWSWYTEERTIWIYNKESPWDDPFGNFTHRNLYPCGIPAQAANTTVIYDFIFRTQNGSKFSYIIEGGNYTTLFSESENAFNTHMITSSHYFAGWTLVLLMAGIYLEWELRKEQDIDVTQEEKDARTYGLLRADGDSAKRLLSIQDIIARSDRMDDLRNNMRVTSGGFIALAVAFILYVQENQFLGSIFIFTQAGAILAVIVNLYILVRSLSDLRKEKDENWLPADMLPRSESVEKYEFQIVHRINLQRALNNDLVKAMKISVACILGTLLGDMCVLFFLSQASFLLTFTFGQMLLVCFVIVLLWVLAQSTKTTLREIGLSL